MRLITSWKMVKILVGLAIVVAVVGVYNMPSHDTACTTVSSYPGRSSVYECKAGLSTVAFRNTLHIPVYASLTADHQSEAWLTYAGDSETIKTVRHLGASVVLSRDGFMAVSTPAQGSVLAYVLSKTTVLLTVVWDVQTTQ